MRIESMEKNVIMEWLETNEDKYYSIYKIEADRRIEDKIIRLFKLRLKNANGMICDRLNQKYWIFIGGYVLEIKEYFDPSLTSGNTFCSEL